MRETRRPIRFTIAVVLAVAGACGLAACSASNHEIVPDANGCIVCHEEKAVYDVSSPTGAIESRGEVAVTMKGANTVEVCRPIFTSEDGSSMTPVEYRTVKVTDGEAATITLDEGTWALVAPDSHAYRIVVVSTSAPEDVPSVSLDN